LAKSKDYYAVLGVLPSIEQTAISAVYKALMRKFHPDVNQGDKAEGERLVKQINAAYEVLGDEEKRAEYDRKRETTENGSGDYGQESYTSDPRQGEQEEKLENWDYATEFHPDAEKCRIELNRFSPRLSMTYQIILLEEKIFYYSVELADKLKEEFLKRYFGSNLAIHRFVKISLRNNRRDVALEVNKAIKIVGSPSEEEEENFISLIRKKFKFYSEDRPPHVDGIGSGGPANKIGRAEALVLIDAIRGLNVSKETLAELAEYKSDITDGEFEQMDLKYLSALYKRLLG